MHTNNISQILVILYEYIYMTRFFRSGIAYSLFTNAWNELKLWEQHLLKSKRFLIPIFFQNQFMKIANIISFYHLCNNYVNENYWDSPINLNERTSSKNKSITFQSFQVKQIFCRPGYKPQLVYVWNYSCFKLANVGQVEQPQQQQQQREW